MGSIKKLFLLALLLLAVLPPISCSAQAEPETITVSIEDWKTLQRNWAAQEKALTLSEAELLAARKALQQSAQELSEAKMLLQELNESSTEAKESVLKLRQELSAQKEESLRLQKELTQLQQESAKASDSLTKANEFLQSTKAEVQAAEKREKRLRIEKGLWQAIAGIALIFAAVK